MAHMEGFLSHSMNLPLSLTQFRCHLLVLPDNGLGHPLRPVLTGLWMCSQIRSSPCPSGL